jgi:hypothetical protein
MDEKSPPTQEAQSKFPFPLKIHSRAASMQRSIFMPLPVLAPMLSFVAACGSTASLIAAPPVADPAATGGRLLGMSVNEPADKNFEAAFQTARSVGIQVVSLNLHWDEVEKAPGRFESPWPTAANAFYGANKVRISLRLATFDTNNNRLPADLRDKPIDDPATVGRFNAFADWVLAQLTDVELADVSIGNEVDVWLGADANKWEQYTAFFKATREHIRNKRPALTVGSNITFPAHTGEAKRFVSELNESADAAMVSYYPLTPTFQVRPPTVVRDDFAELCAAYENKEIRFTEIGYPSGDECGSSLAKQKQFIDEVFAAWDAHKEQVKSVVFVWLHDRPPEEIEHYKTYYKISDAAFLSYLGTLGLRAHEKSGTDKPAFVALRKLAKSRGW